MLWGVSGSTHSGRTGEWSGPPRLVLVAYCRSARSCVPTPLGIAPLSEARKLTRVAEPPQLAKYELGEELGHGGMASVYRALDRRLGREVAVKIIHHHLRENQEVAARFTSEARAVAKLRHPNIVEVYDVSDDGEPERYLVVELVRGTTLRRLLLTHGRLPPEIGALITIEIAEALGHAHEQGVIHRDVKPENVLVDLCGIEEANGDAGHGPRTRIKITDFGIAKLLDAQGVTSTGQVLGSPAHMSPEQIEGGNVSPQSDVFGLGVLLYECVVGRMPFDGKNPAQVLRRVLDGKFTPAERARGTVGAGFGSVIDRALAHDPKDRYPGTAELIEDLKRELAVVGFADARQEFEAFLRDPQTYWDAYTPRIIQHLVDLGRSARAKRDFPLAAAYFNRALAHRPDDAELLRQVSGLAHAQRLRRFVRNASGAAGVAVVVALLTYGISRLVQGQTETLPRSVPEAAAAEAAAPAIRAESRARTLARARPSARPLEAAPAKKRVQKAPFVPRIPEPTRQRVRVLIDGVTGGEVRVAGKTLTHGDEAELEVGVPYTFRFSEPSGQKGCCQGEQKTVVIDPGVKVVRGQVSFLPARIQATGAPTGSTINCGIGVGSQVTPGVISVEVGGEPRQVDCIVSPRDGSVGRRTGGTLGPGQTLELWP